MGEGTLDLSELGVVRANTSVRASVGLGHLVVLVPEDQEVLVNTEVGAGSAVVFGHEQNGMSFDTHELFRGEGRTLVLDLEVGMGQVEVRRAGPPDELEPIDPADPIDEPDPIEDPQPIG
jgi:predicted membrane protein